MRAFFLFIVITFIVSAPALAQFPSDAGFINVKDYGAKGDGVHDDTKSILKAIAASGGDKGPTFWQDKIIFFPEGTYLVSAPLHKKYKNGGYASGMALMGAGKDETIIKLKDNAEGFNNSRYPASVIFTSSKLIGQNATGGGKDYARLGEGNDAYMNYIENLTIDVGEGNPAAIGIDYLANNMGAIRNVKVIAPESSGATGVSMMRKWPGPLLIQNVEIEGFDIGIDVAQTEYGVTLDHVKLRGQKKIGLQNNKNMVSANDLFISGAPKNINNVSDHGMIALAGKGVYTGDTFTKPNWKLQAKDAPVIHQDPIEKWAKVGAGEATASIRAAFASGASTIYFPNGVYEIKENITIPSSVKRIVGMHSTITRHDQRSPDFRSAKGLFIVAEDGPPLTIEKLAFDNTDRGAQTAVEISDNRKVLLRDIVGAGVKTLERKRTGGPVFIENTCCGTVNIEGSKGLWARQLNSEGYSARVTNNDAPVWILGIKTEGHTTAVKNIGKAQTEIIGGLLYVVHEAKDRSKPAFINDNGRLVASFVEEAFSARNTYGVYVADSAGNAKIMPEAYLKRGAGRAVSNLSDK